MFESFFENISPGGILRKQLIGNKPALPFKPDIVRWTNQLRFHLSTTYILGYIIIIIIRQPLCPVVGRRPQHAVSKLPCLVLSSAISCRSSICPGRLSIAWLVSLVVFSCHMVSNWWHARSIGRLWGGWYALPRTISFFLQCWLYLWLLSSPWPRCWSFCLCMWCWAYFFPFLSVRPQVCSVLVWSVSMSLHHMS